MQSAAWGPQISSLAQNHRVIAPDLPGHGQSDPLPEGSQLPAFVSWCRDVLRALDLRHINLAGHSMGALIALGYTAGYPDEVNRLALLNCVYKRDDRARQAVITRAAEISTGTLDFETPLERWFSNRPSNQAARARVAEWLSAVDAAGYATAYGAFARGDATYADKLHRIHCPTLALTGAEDPNSTPAMARALATAIADGQAIVVEGHRHMVNLTASQVVNRHLINWLKHPIAAREMQ
jgi:pimeloyl-ACP methyl ester carboxylesterase